MSGTCTATFGSNRPKTVVELHDMMQRWANQEDQEQDHYLKHDNDNGGKRNNDHLFDKG